MMEFLDRTETTGLAEYDALLGLVGDTRLALLREASHGTHGSERQTYPTAL